MPNDIKPLLVTLDCGYGCPVFIPTLAQIGGMNTTEWRDVPSIPGEWNYFNERTSRSFRDVSGTTRTWWLQTQYKSSYAVCCVSTAGYILDHGYPGSTYGFRPCFAMDTSILDAYSKFKAWKSIL